MGTRIYQHEPSRHLFLGICDAAEALVSAPDGMEFLEKLFLLEKEFHPSGVSFAYMVPDEDNLKVDLNGQFVYDAKFFLPKQLEAPVVLIRRFYFDLIGFCETHRRRTGFAIEHRTEVERYAPYGLTVGPKTRASIRAAIDRIRYYFLKTHVLVN